MYNDISCCCRFDNIDSFWQRRPVTDGSSVDGEYLPFFVIGQKVLEGSIRERIGPYSGSGRFVACLIFGLDLQQILGIGYESDKCANSVCKALVGFTVKIGGIASDGNIIFGRLPSQRDAIGIRYGMKTGGHSRGCIVGSHYR